MLLLVILWRHQEQWPKNLISVLPSSCAFCHKLKQVQEAVSLCGCGLTFATLHRYLYIFLSKPTVHSLTVGFFSYAFVFLYIFISIIKLGSLYLQKWSIELFLENTISIAGLLCSTVANPVCQLIFNFPLCSVDKALKKGVRKYFYWKQ